MLFFPLVCAKNEKYLANAFLLFGEEILFVTSIKIVLVNSEDGHENKSTCCRQKVCWYQFRKILP